MDVYCARSLKQQSAPLGHVVLIRAKQFVIVLTNALCLVEKKHISIIQSFGLIRNEAQIRESYRTTNAVPKKRNMKQLSMSHIYRWSPIDK